jgi:hypothetical protein
MKSEATHSRVQLESNILEGLVTEVKETVARDVKMPEAKKSTFGALDMWAMRRKTRYVAYTRKKPAIIIGFGY